MTHKKVVDIVSGLVDTCEARSPAENGNSIAGAPPTHLAGCAGWHSAKDIATRLGTKDANQGKARPADYVRDLPLQLSKRFTAALWSDDHNVSR